jgi:hypothetical protein
MIVSVLQCRWTASACARTARSCTPKGMYDFDCKCEFTQMRKGYGCDRIDNNWSVLPT